MKNKRNWAQYNQSLVNRGNITFWFSDDVLASWNHPNHDYRRGRHSFIAIPLSKHCLLFARFFI
ncbi:MAG: hypothetical protein PHO46_04650 [Thermoguttaceae bacterium]|nr:hypothetical protein [Thermoguttaceae bacterium]